jgi:hypothetical protein
VVAAVKPHIILKSSGRQLTLLPIQAQEGLGYPKHNYMNIAVYGCLALHLYIMGLSLTYIT